MTDKPKQLATTTRFWISLKTGLWRWLVRIGSAYALCVAIGGIAETYHHKGEGRIYHHSHVTRDGEVSGYSGSEWVPEAEFKRRTYIGYGFGIGWCLYFLIGVAPNLPDFEPPDFGHKKR